MYFTRILLSIVFACLLPLSAYAKSDPPDISGVMVMNDLDAIMVEGVNFAVETPLLVTLGPPGSPGDITADCTLEDDTLITCEFPAGLPPAGDYRLIVLTGSGKNKGSNGYALTIGAVGPIGPQGDAGTDGSDGSDGNDGLNGGDGADGAPGADGADGTSCSISECVEPGEATMTCGPDSVQVPCILPPQVLLTCPCWNSYTETEMVTALNGVVAVDHTCSVFIDGEALGDATINDPETWVINTQYSNPFVGTCKNDAPFLLPSVNEVVGYDAALTCFAELSKVIPQVTWCSD
jgi:hypothetical protein